MATECSTAHINNQLIAPGLWDESEHYVVLTLSPLQLKYSMSPLGEVPAQNPKDTKRHCPPQPQPVHPAAV